MAKKARRIEGFVPRSSNEQRPTLDDVSGNLQLTKPKYSSTMDIFAKKSAKKDREISPTSSDINSDIMASLSDLPGYDTVDNDGLNDTTINKKALKKRHKQNKKDKKNKKSKKPLKVFLIILSVLAVIILGVFLAYKYLWPEETIEGEIWDIFQQEKLQEDANGRSNILIFGTEPDGYDGADLTDSILLLSLNQTDGTAYMVSLPRDLYVRQTCPNFGTSAGRINQVYACYINDDGSNETESAAALQTKVGEILGLDVQYYVHLNWAGFEQIINSVGGVDVTIESSDPRGIYDVSTGIQFENGEVHLDGETALALARARGSAGGYGLEGSNFAREVHQQKIIKAVVEKIVSGQTLTDVGQMLSLVNAMDDNLHTNFKTSELEALANLAKTFNTDNIVSLPLLDTDNDIVYVTNDNIGGASVVVPTAGTYNYSEIQAYIAKSMSSDPVIREGAEISVLNGTAQPGLAQEEADKLAVKNYTIGYVGNAPDGNYAAIEIYLINTSMTATASTLADLYGVEVKNVVPAGISAAGADIVIVVGQAPTQ